MSLTQRSIKSQLRLGTIISSGFALLVACTSFLIYDWASDRRNLRDRTTTIANIFAYNSSAVLEFEDTDGAIDVLSALALQSGIRAARIYGMDGQPFADYVRRDVGDPALPERAPLHQNVFDKGELTVVTPIEAGEEQVGTLYIACELTELNQSLRMNLLITGALLVICSLIALVLGSRVHRGVTGPLLELAKSAEEYSRKGNTSVRAKPRSGDELGLLVTALNQMLDQIERNEHEMRAQLVKVQLLNTALKAQKERADAAGEARTRFLANMSHELRTPLTAIRGFLDLLGASTGMSRLSSEQWDHLAVVDRNVDALIETINNVLDVTQLEAGSLNVETVRFDPAPLIAEIRASLEGAARRKKLRFEVESDESVPDEMKGDPARLRQVLLQLVENAIKFTSEGEVRVRVIGREGPTGQKLQIDVTDTGIGIHESQLEDLFEPFVQVDSSASREHAGTGLGLAICQRLCETMGGSLTVESEIGRGSRFRVTLPVDPLALQPQAASTPPAESSASADESPPSLNAKILLVEDGLDNQRLVSLILRGAGAEIVVAENGRIGLETALAAWEGGAPFDVILMDLQMPEMDGYEATRRLRERGYTRPIIALTANAIPEERQRSLEAGCDAVESKPINGPVLIQAMRSHLQALKES